MSVGHVGYLAGGERACLRPFPGSNTAVGASSRKANNRRERQERQISGNEPRA